MLSQQPSTPLTACDDFFDSSFPKTSRACLLQTTFKLLTRYQLPETSETTRQNRVSNSFSLFSPLPNSSLHSKSSVTRCTVPLKLINLVSSLSPTPLALPTDSLIDPPAFLTGSTSGAAPLPQRSLSNSNIHTAQTSSWPALNPYAYSSSTPTSEQPPSLPSSTSNKRRASPTTTSEDTPKSTTSELELEQWKSIAESSKAASKHWQKIAEEWKELAERWKGDADDSKSDLAEWRSKAEKSRAEVSALEDKIEEMEKEREDEEPCYKCGRGGC